MTHFAYAINPNKNDLYGHTLDDNVISALSDGLITPYNSDLYLYIN